MLRAKALAIKSARWLFRARADDWLRIWAECKRRHRGKPRQDKEERRQSWLYPLVYAIGIFPWSYPLSMSPGEGSPNPSRWLICLMANPSFFGFTFNQLSHFLRLLCDCWFVPLSLISTNLSWKRKSYSEHVGSCVACFLPTLRYGTSLPRGPLGGLGTSSSGTQTTCALGKDTSYGGAFTVEVKRALQS
jgi:hypothetical protein